MSLRQHLAHTLTHRMLKALAIGFVAAIAITVCSVLLFAALEPHVTLAWAFAPGFAIMRLYELSGARPTNRFAINSTFLFWWLMSVVVLLLLRLRRAD
jgi:uncharacterized membrane protein